MSIHRISHSLTPLARPAPRLSLRTTHDGPAVVIQLSGELDPATVPLLTELVAETARRRSAVRLVLDLAGVTFFCAAGIHAFLAARRCVVATGGALVLRAPSPAVRRVLAITGDDRHFAIEEVEPAKVAAA
jgi:anti-anti-sigma factor